MLKNVFLCSLRFGKFLKKNNPRGNTNPEKFWKILKQIFFGKFHKISNILKSNCKNYIFLNSRKDKSGKEKDWDLNIDWNDEPEHRYTERQSLKQQLLI